MKLLGARSSNKNHHMKYLQPINEVKGLFSKNEKVFLVAMINSYDMGKTIKATLGNLNNFSLDYVIKVVKYYLDNIDTDDNPDADDANDILDSLRSIQDRAKMLQKSEKGFIVQSTKSLKDDNSGPYATSGYSIMRYTIKTKKRETELRTWMESKHAKSGMYMTQEIITLDFIGNDLYLVDVKTTVYYN
jgi:hypothetical protein